MLRPTCFSPTFWPFVWRWLFLNKLFTLYQDNISSEKKGQRQDRTLENVSQEMVNLKTRGLHRKIRPISTMLTFYNRIRTAIKKRSVCKNIHLRSYLHLTKVSLLTLIEGILVSVNSQSTFSTVKFKYLSFVCMSALSHVKMLLL